jgi:hypothetical protein
VRATKRSPTSRSRRPTWPDSHRLNAIVDISDVAGAKYAAIAEHKSQLAQRDYVAYARGLNAYRAMTLPPETKFAEAYFVVELPSLRTTPISDLRHLIGAPKEIAVTSEPLPVSVVIRTKNRPALLEEAIRSVRATDYPCEIVVVNDGGAPLDLNGAKLVQHETSRGRAEAGNTGVRTASNAFVVFLDDDDLFYPEHLATLATRRRHPTSPGTRTRSAPSSALMTAGACAFTRTTSIAKR